MKTAINPGDYVEIIGGEWDGGRGTVQTVYDDGYKIRLPEGEVKVYPSSTTRLPFAETETQPPITLKHLTGPEEPYCFITAQGLSQTSGNEPDRDEVEVCKQWIRRYATPRQDINQAWPSDVLQRNVSRWSHRRVSNGAFILAATELGYRYAPMEGGDNENACFNMIFPPRNTAKRSEAFPD